MTEDTDIARVRELRACEKIVASDGRLRSAGAQEPECILKYMRIPSTAGTRDPERSRFFHKLSASVLRKIGVLESPTKREQGLYELIEQLAKSNQDPAKTMGTFGKKVGKYRLHRQGP